MRCHVSDVISNQSMKRPATPADKECVTGEHQTNIVDDKGDAPRSVTNFDFDVAHFNLMAMIELEI